MRIALALSFAFALACITSSCSKDCEVTQSAPTPSAPTSAETGALEVDVRGDVATRGVSADPVSAEASAICRKGLCPDTSECVEGCPNIDDEASCAEYADALDVNEEQCETSSSCASQQKKCEQSKSEKPVEQAPSR